MTHQEDDHQVLLLILCVTQCPSSRLSACHAPLRYRWLSLSCSRSPLPTTHSFHSETWNQPKGRKLSETFRHRLTSLFIHHHYTDFWEKGLNRLQTSCCFTCLRHFVCFRPLLLIKRTLKASNDCNIFIISLISLPSCKLWYDWLPPDLHKKCKQKPFKWLVLAGLLSLRVTHFLESHYLKSALFQYCVTWGKLWFFFF